MVEDTSGTAGNYCQNCGRSCSCGLTHYYYSSVSASYTNASNVFFGEEKILPVRTRPELKMQQGKRFDKHRRQPARYPGRPPKRNGRRHRDQRDRA